MVGLEKHSVNCCVPLKLKWLAQLLLQVTDSLTDFLALVDIRAFSCWFFLATYFFTPQVYLISFLQLILYVCMIVSNLAINESINSMCMNHKVKAALELSKANKMRKKAPHNIHIN